MRFLILWILTVCTLVHTSELTPERDFCFAVDMWLSKKMVNPKEICSAARPFSPECNQMQNIAQSICFASPHHFGLCSTVKILSVGICKALGEQPGVFCSEQPVQNDEWWVGRLRRYCGINLSVF